jgi:adenosine tuberculosinyltransferase
MMELETFLNLPTEEVAQIVQEAGPKVCVFPINGTRRWFMIEHPTHSGVSFLGYLDIVIKRHIEIYQLFFNHGIKTLLTPIFGPDLMKRGEDYMKLAADGMERIASHPDFLKFYQAYDVRVRCYGDYHKFLNSTSYAYLSEKLDKVTEMTLSHNENRLFFGVFAHDATETIAKLSIDYYKRHKKAPSKYELVELYYGEYVEPVSFFIGFDKFSTFDMPLVATGDEDLYFTIAPSLYLNKEQLRTILYDHIYLRPQIVFENYTSITREIQDFMQRFYHTNLGNTIGVGIPNEEIGFWYPQSQIEIPGEL